MKKQEATPAPTPGPARGASQPKKAYEPPVLVEWGTVADLTKGRWGRPGDTKWTGTRT